MQKLQMLYVRLCLQQMITNTKLQDSKMQEVGLKT